MAEAELEQNLIDETDVEPPNPKKVRGGHISYLTTLFNDVEGFLQQNTSVVDMKTLGDKIENQFKQAESCKKDKPSKYYSRVNLKRFK